MPAPGDFTLRRYVESIRRQVVLILVVVLVCAIVGGAFSVLKKTPYSATASLAASDPNASLAAGGNLLSSETPLQLASAAAPQVTRAEVVAGVLNSLGPSNSARNKLSTALLLKRVSVTIDPNSYLIDIAGTGRTAVAAERVANAFARVDVTLSNAESRIAYRRQAGAVRQELSHVNPTSTQAVTMASTLARLENLASVASPLSVSAFATSASGPSALKRVRTVVAAALFGLLLAIAIATGRDALDRRIRRAEELAELLAYPIIGSIRHEAMGHAGVSTDDEQEPVGPVGPLEDPDLESFRILRQNLSFLAPSDPGRVVIVTSAMPQEGKSTVAAGLAMAATESGKRTLLVDCDLRRPVLAERLGLNPTPGLTDYLTSEAEPEDLLQVIGATPVSEVEQLAGSETTDAQPSTATDAPARTGQLVCITAGTTIPSPADLLLSDRFRDFVNSVADVYDLVILDAPPILPVVDALEVLPLVSKVLLCVRLRQTTRDQTAAAQDALERLPAKPVGVVVTDVRPQESGRYGGYYSYDYSTKAASPAKRRLSKPD